MLTAVLALLLAAEPSFIGPPPPPPTCASIEADLLRQEAAVRATRERIAKLCSIAPVEDCPCRCPEARR